MHARVYVGTPDVTTTDIDSYVIALYVFTI